MSDSTRPTPETRAAEREDGERSPTCPTVSPRVTRTPPPRPSSRSRSGRGREGNGRARRQPERRRPNLLMVATVEPTTDLYVSPSRSAAGRAGPAGGRPGLVPRRPDRGSRVLHRRPGRLGARASPTGAERMLPGWRGRLLAGGEVLAARRPARPGDLARGRPPDGPRRTRALRRRRRRRDHRCASARPRGAPAGRHAVARWLQPAPARAGDAQGAGGRHGPAELPRATPPAPRCACSSCCWSSSPQIPPVPVWSPARDEQDARLGPRRVRLPDRPADSAYRSVAAPLGSAVRESSRRSTREECHVGLRVRFRPGVLVDVVVLPVLHLDLDPDHGLRGHLPQPRPLRLGEGDLGDLRDLHAVPRRVRVPHRPRAQDERARAGGGAGPGRGASASTSSRPPGTGGQPGRRAQPPRGPEGRRASSTTPSSSSSRPRSSAEIARRRRGPRSRRSRRSPGRSRSRRVWRRSRDASTR